MMRAEYQKWDYITLPDFRAHSVGPFLSYGWLWFLAIVSVAVYGSDTFTAVSLLAYNRWSSQFVPVIPLDIAKWIFAGCILFSWILCGYEWFCAVKVIRRGNVAESYLNPLAVVLQSMRVFGDGMGWRRFLVFAELTKSKKGADYVALFCCFQFKGAIRILLAEGPRQVINALTLYSVMKAKLLTDEGNAPADGQNSFDRFWVNVKVLYEAAPEQAVVLFTMLFTLIIWVFSILSLITAFLLWVGFLLHYIPRDELPLNAYCRRKVDKRLGRVVNAKTKQAIEKEDLKRRRDEEKGKDSFARPAAPTRKPTLPLLPEKTPIVSSLQHSNSVSSTATGPSMHDNFGRQATLPQLDEDEPTLPQLGQESDLASGLNRSGTLLSNNSSGSFGAHRMNSVSSGSQHSYFDRPGAPSRSPTELSGVSMSSYNPDRPLLQNSAEPGYSITPYEIESPETQPTNQGTYGTYNQYTPRIPRSNTGMSNITTASAMSLPPRAITGMERKPLPIRSMTSSSQRSLLGGPANFNASYRGLPNGHLAEANRNNGYQAARLQSVTPSNPTEGQSFELQPTRRPVHGAPATSGYMPYRVGAGLDANSSQTQGPWSQDPHLQPQSQTQQSQASVFMPLSNQQQFTRAGLPLTHPQIPSRAMTVSNSDLASGAQPFDRIMPPARVGTAPNPLRGRDGDRHYVGGGSGQGWMQTRPPDGSHGSGFRGDWV